MSALIVEAFADLLTDTPTLDPPGKPVCQLIEHGTWFTVPLDWNTCCHLVDRGLDAARIVAADGVVMRAYPVAEKEHA